MPDLIILCSRGRRIHDEPPATAALSGFADAYRCTHCEKLLTRTGSLADCGPRISNSGRTEMMQPGLRPAHQTKKGSAATVVSGRVPDLASQRHTANTPIPCGPSTAAAFTAVCPWGVSVCVA
jgi:hypothetical protein